MKTLYILKGRAGIPFGALVIEDCNSHEIIILRDKFKEKVGKKVYDWASARDFVEFCKDNGYSAETYETGMVCW